MRLSTVAFIAMVMIFVAIVWGAYVRALGAGLGCGPEWPMCQGELVPRNIAEFFVFLEYVHRLLALTAALSVLATVYIAVRFYKHRPNLIRWASTTMILIIVQILMGMIVVILELDPISSAFHLTLATITFGASVVLTVLSFIEDGVIKWV
jgi:heme A synthase